MTTATQLMTAEELIRLPRGQFRYDLVKGELITMAPAGEEHGAVTVNLTVPLAQHVKTHNLGRVYSAETGFKVESNPDTVLGPDIAFVSREKLEVTGIGKGYRQGAPDLAVEVISPSESKSQSEQKAFRYLSAGTRLVWLVKPQTHSVIVYRSASDVTVLNEGDQLKGEDVVPGFSFSVREIFA
jgi:Uma2 family endonuclease